jgi:hypothetical protein
MCQQTNIAVTDSPLPSVFLTYTVRTVLDSYIVRDTVGKSSVREGSKERQEEEYLLDAVELLSFGGAGVLKEIVPILTIERSISSPFRAFRRCKAKEGGPVEEEAKDRPANCYTT